MQKQPLKINQPSQRALLARLRRAEGQLRGIARLIEKEAEHEEVACQLRAVRRALDRIFYEMIGCSIEQSLEQHPELGTLQPTLTQIARLLAKYG